MRPLRDQKAYILCAPPVERLPQPNHHVGCSHCLFVAPSEGDLLRNRSEGGTAVVEVEPVRRRTLTTMTLATWRAQ